MNKIIIISMLILTVFLILWVIAGLYIQKNLEEPDYKVTNKTKFYEIREYKSYIIAETEVSGSYNEAVSKGFRILADYIFGNNKKRDKIEMTTPVTTKKKMSEKIKMTVPVISEKNKQSWSIAFVMPKKYTLDTLPEANTDKISFKKVKEKKIAVHTFTWYVSEKRIKEKTSLIIDALKKDGYKIDHIQSARYNPPFSPPFMFRNEIWAILK